jgi:excisionase family DNA binding protein
LEPTVTQTARPSCKTCKHSISFHGSGETACRALGCRCNAYKGEQTHCSTAEVAKILGKSTTWVQRHADELGAIRRGTALRFKRETVERYAAQL